MLTSVPTNLITGFLGVGKTTAIRSILGRKPPHEEWAVVVNEFGEIGIDGTMFDGESEQIRMVPGGCICCVSNVAMGVALTDLIRRQRPDRILIEPTGLGHPAGVLDLLRRSEQAGQIDLRATLCLVDPRRVNELSVGESEVFQDQIHMADVLIGHKWDLSNNVDKEAFQAWASGMFPPKVHFTSASNGLIDLELLDLNLDPSRTPLFPEAHAANHRHGLKGEPDLAPNRPLHFKTEGDGYVSCGWLFSPSDVFNRRNLLNWAEDINGISRLKGVFRTGRHWMLVNRSDDEMGKATIAYRRDSRVEIIAKKEKMPDWDDVGASLLACLRLRGMKEI
ncbi:MAG: cobalamin biosynthesis protein P47K [Rhodospirillaceae bacterium]|nr:cobalamin biosynthesis protein P47K [Rhodospirillaceae bacterium]MBC27766.1 cobalamin biosynthesis protein P47K [Rhodospirillaceae bacterium]|tara:strand:- start:1240 stop:2247 length:1008 start_codon:yes stop_codon:yes gene_type:complete